ncbi:Maf family protein [Falsibacillus pallidus]|uniref:Maf family protein n=1 Tax=Falsibacillus pallidus TaxID=493781 RepID=UPI003D98DB12
MNRLILASGSPRRKELLQKLQVPFDIFPSDADENLPEGIAPDKAVLLLAEKKAKTVADSFPEGIVIGSDTVVALGDEILGKPLDSDDAKSTLKKLSGRTHSVYTGVSIIKDGKPHSFFEKTEVTFWALTDQEINRYIETGEPFDKAGSYGIQGYGSLFVKEIKGDYYAVVGLPVSRLYRELKSAGLNI